MVVLQEMLVRAPNFQPSLRDENACAAPGKTAGVHRGDRRKRRIIESVVDVEMLVGLESAANHRARTRVAWANSDRENSWVARQIPNPNGIEPFIENPERRQESAYRHGDVWTGDEVELRVFLLFLNHSMEPAHAWLLGKIRFKRPTRLKQPPLAKRHKQDGSEQRMDMCFASIKNSLNCRRYLQDRNRFDCFRILQLIVGRLRVRRRVRRLCEDLPGGEDLQEQGSSEKERAT